MNNKSAKKLKRLAKVLAGNKPKQEQDKIYKRLKSVHKSNKGQL